LGDNGAEIFATKTAPPAFRSPYKYSSPLEYMPSVNVPRLIELLLKRHEKLYDLWIRSQNTSIEEALDKECHALFRIIFTLQNISPIVEELESIQASPLAS
jgi:hypothetical protein